MWRTGVLSSVALLLMSASLLAQAPGRITGAVVSSDGTTPVVGAQIVVAGTTVGTLTRDDGRYTVALAPGTYTVRAIRLGYRPDSVTGISVVSGGTTTANFTLQATAVQLGGMVVIGYGTQEARNTTGSVEKVDAKEFNTGRIVSPEQLIQAKVPGVQVVDNNEPGGGISVRIRGGTSVTSSNEPLFVLDGVPLPVGGGVNAGRNALNFLNPNDIESITVLKDASATSIYGSRGANGVVLITTKSGLQNAQFTYDGSVSNSVVVREPDLLDASQFRAAVTQYAPTNLSVIGTANTDWRKAIQRNARGQEHTIALAGSREDMRYRMSLGYLDQSGVVQGTTAQRTSASLTYSDHMFSDILEVRANLKGSRTDDRFTPNGVLGAATAFAPTQPIRTASGNYFQWSNALGANNPIADLAMVTDHGTDYRSVGNLETKVRAPFLDGLSATVRAGYDIARAQRTFFSPSTAQGQTESSGGGNLARNTPSQLNTLLEIFGNYTRNLDRFKSDVDVTAGYTFEQFQYDSSRTVVAGLSTDLLGPNGIPGTKTQSEFLDVQESRLVSGFARASLTVRDRYLFSASVRRDGSSRFGPGNQWGVFPSVAFAWRMFEEPFMPHYGGLSDLKLRVSWGLNGNQAFNNYLAYSTYAVGNSLAQVQFGNTFISTIRPGAVDPNIKWEQTSSTDVGIDYGFWDNRITGTVDYYRKKTTDLIFNVPVAAGTNLSNYVTTNIGSLENRGLEFGLNTRVFDGRNGAFTWDAGFNAAKNSNKLLRLNAAGAGNEQILTGDIDGGVGSKVEVLQPGYPINSFFVYRHKMENGKPIYRDVNGDGTIDQDDLYQDLNGDHVINQNDRATFKSPAPKWILGQSSFMGYRNFDLGYTLRAYLGNYTYNNVASNLGHYSAIRSAFPANLEASVLKTNFVEPQYFSDVYVEDASFLRMDNITLGYTFRGLRSVKQLRLYGTVQNVFTITKYSGVDPNAGVFGIDRNIYPLSRTFTTGVSVGF